MTTTKKEYGMAKKEVQEGKVQVEVNLSLLDELAVQLSKTDPITVARYMDQKQQGLINPIVLAKLMGVRPQMIYNYIRKGRFTQEDAFGINSTQKITIRLNEAIGFASSYVGRKENREEAEANKIQRELRGE